MILEPGFGISKITERIFIGNYYSAEMLEYGNRHSITHVLNCTPSYHKGLKDFVVRQLNIDDGSEVPQEAIQFGVRSIAEAVQSSGKILVHCMAGISRSPSIVAAYLMYVGFSWDEAIDFIRVHRPFICPHPNVARSIKKAMGNVISAQTTLLGAQ